MYSTGRKTTCAEKNNINLGRFRKTNTASAGWRNGGSPNNSSPTDGGGDEVDTRYCCIRLRGSQGVTLKRHGPRIGSATRPDWSSQASPDQKCEKGKSEATGARVLTTRRGHMAVEV